MLSACCSTVSPTTSSTCFVCSYLRRCAPHKLKRCAFSCSRSVRASAKQLVASAFIGQLLAFPGSLPSRVQLLLDCLACSTTHSPQAQGGAISKNGPLGQQQ